MPYKDIEDRRKASARFREKNKDKIKKEYAQFQKTPLGKFHAQKSRAKQRGIVWELTFSQWLEIWNKSGKFDSRGIFKGCYQMCRFNDDGAYAVDNVEIKTTEENSREHVQTRGHDDYGRFI